QQRAEIAVLEGVDRRRVAEAGQHAGAQPRVVVVDEEERLVVPVVAGELDRPAERGAVVGVAEGRGSGSRLLREEPGRIELVIREVPVPGTAVRVRARLAGVFDEAAAGVAVLGRVAGRDDLHFLNGLDGRRALLALLMADGIAERGAVEEILG